MPIRFYSGNYLENLVYKLSEDIKLNTVSPFEGPTVIVQSQGMMKWISLELAKRNGICANVDFRFPKDFIYECFHKTAGSLPEENLYEKEVMTWKIMDILPKFLENKEFSSLKAYLKHGESALKYYQLSEKIASLYDQYLIFRPEWTLKWEKGIDTNTGSPGKEKWQAILWRALVEELGTGHPAQVSKDFKEAFNSRTDIGELLPRNIYIFGISSLPPFHVDILNFISGSDDISMYMYHLNPSKEYWGDITKKHDSNLLASMGILGRDFSKVLLNYEIDQNVGGDLYAKDFEGKNLLSFYQKDIFELNDPASELADPRSEFTKYKIEDGDKSLSIHSCHSPMREVEALYDNLLDMFNRDSALKPSDIIVMAPDIETYAPYIDAVFGTVADQKLKIPYSIADRSIRRESQIIDTFLNLLDMNSGRLTSVEVLSILEVPAVLRKFGISETELESIQHWIKDTEVRWGKDSEARKKLDLPDFEENTWEAGFKRLFLGYAMPGENEKFFNDILPYDHIEGMDAVSLGKLYEFINKLYSAIDLFGQKLTLKEWSKRLTELTGELFKPEYLQQPEINKLNSSYWELEKHQNMAGFNEEVDIALVSYYLKCRLESESSGHGFLKKGITFCSLLPMRSIPFKAVCLIGMDHDAFPRESKSPGFDLMKEKPLPGDRSKRLDDRYLFLESLISAREKLYISYNGQSIKDNSTIPPSVLVSELIDYAQNYFTFPIEEKLKEEEKNSIKNQEKEKLLENKAFNFLVTKHKLQAFNPSYFKGENGLFSFSEINCRTAQNYLLERRKSVPIGMNDVMLKPPEIKELNINELISFFDNPSKYFLEKRLGIYLKNKDESLETSESFELNKLNETILGNDIIEKAIEKLSVPGEEFKEDDFLTDHYKINRASGKLPHGSPGEISFQKLSKEAVRFAQTVSKQYNGKQAESKEIKININGISITGMIGPVYDCEIIRYRYARIKASDKLRLWIYFLAANAAENDETRVRAKMICRDKEKEVAVWDLDYQDLQDEQDEQDCQDERNLGDGQDVKVKWGEFCWGCLSELVEIYLMGVCKPVRFFPKSSWAYFEERLNIAEKIKGAKMGKNGKKAKVIDENDFSSAIKKAQEEWDGYFNTEYGYIAGEKEDASYRMCFGDCDVFDESFEKTSMLVFGKMSRYLKVAENAE